MALSAGVIRGIATQLLMNQHPTVSRFGVQVSYTKQTCDFIRNLLEKEGVDMVEQYA
jgi:hypothetical protein